MKTHTKNTQESRITSVNEKSENALLVDFPIENKFIWYPDYNWDYQYTHFNVLMKDNSLVYKGQNLLKLNEFLWNKTEWY